MNFSFLLKNWRIALLAVGALAWWGTIVHMRDTIEDLEDDVAAEQQRRAAAQTALQTERANATELARRLEVQRAEYRAERRARTAAEEARDQALAASQDRSDGLRETIVIEREADVTLDRCLALELPDSVVRQLPFGAGGAGPDNR